MCGIFAQAGDFNPKDAERAAALFSYRGPDGTHQYTDKQITLIQHRLAVIDPRSIADQPYWNDERTVGIVFNGEIYNFRQLRALLPDMHWKTEGDTEVILRLYEKYGDSFAGRLDGMYAIVIYDLRSGVVTAIRDPFGVKPLYYSSSNIGLVCASELKGVAAALRTAGQPLIPRTDMHELYLALGYVPAPATIVENIFMLPPGHILSYDVGHRTHTIKPLSHEESADDEDPIQAIKDSILRNTVADVPLGLFLSGGIDSTFIAHTLAEAGMNPKAFTLDIPHRTDAPYAEQVALTYGMRHEIIPFTQARFDEAYAVIRERIDAPTADSSLIPTHALAREARKSVTVVLSGEGGDEVFLGYARHMQLARLSVGKRANVARAVGSNLPLRARRAIAYMLGDASSYYLLAAGIAPTPAAAQQFAQFAFAEGARPVDFDLRFYLENDLLRKIDLATMYASLEGRVPFCSERVLRAARRDEASLLRQDTKAILKAHLAQTLPHDLVYRTKSGFSAPFNEYAPASEMVQEDMQNLPAFLRERFGSLAEYALNASERNHYARFGLLSLMHAYRNLGI